MIIGIVMVVVPGALCALPAVDGAPLVAEEFVPDGVALSCATTGICAHASNALNATVKHVCLVFFMMASVSK